MLTVDHERPHRNGHAGAGGDFDVRQRPDSTEMLGRQRLRSSTGDIQK